MGSLVISKKSTKTASDQRPMMLLKDYLLDDMSSCSSNGFKLFPRRGQCCPPTVRFLIDADLTSNFYSTSKKRRHPRKGAIWKASEAVINAFKLLRPFPASSSSVKSAAPLFKLPRSFSRKLFKRGYFSRKMAADKEGDVRRWTYFQVEPNRTPKPEKLISSTVQSSTSSSSGARNDEGSINSCSTWELSNSESSGNNAVTEGEKSWSTGVEKVGVSGERETSVGGVEADIGSTNKEWRIEDKQQFSPVSVLDCNFEDEEEITSPFTGGSLVHFQGTKKKIMGKMRRIHGLTKLEPVDLQKRFASIESEAESLESPRPSNLLL